MKQLQNAKERVKSILKKHKATRDNDTLLVLKFWESESGSYDVSSEDALTLTPPDTITRMRRRVQAEHPELRGKMYEKRSIYRFEWQTAMAS